MGRRGASAASHGAHAGRRTFLPRDLRGCVLWLRADLGITIGTGVSAWADQSGAGHHAVQAVGANQISYLASGGINGRASLNCDGNAKWLQTSGALFSGAGTRTTMVMYKPAASTGTRCAIGVSGSTTPGRWWTIYARSSPQGDPYFSGYAADLQIGTMDTNAKCAIATYDGTNTSLYKNGTLGAGPTAMALNTFATGMIVGTDVTSGGANFFGYIGEIVVYNRALSAAEIARLTAYTRGFWGHA